ncbi:MAG TPA: PAS domain-containing protein [Thermodesulfovibrionales bacterium]|nr:PAS domain-containing protein [Thermodesulfovibrionales bacterium]
MARENKTEKIRRREKSASGTSVSDSADVEPCLATAAELLKNPAAMYCALVEHVPAVVYIAALDVQTTPVFISPQIRTLLGFLPHEFYGTDLWLQLIYPEDRQKVIDARANTRTSLSGLALEYRVFAKDGGVLWFRDRAEVLRDHKGNPLCLQGVVLDITDLKHAEKRYRELGGHLLSVREEERKRIAREIHDELGQVMTALKLELDLIGSELGENEGACSRRLKGMTKLITGALKTVKRISSELRPPALDTLSLGAAVEWEAGEFQKRTGIRCEAFLEPAEIDLDRRTSTDVFRIIQEALTNVVRHAGAKRVRVTLKKRAHDMLIEVSDNGRGITKEQALGKNSFGLLGMRERVSVLGGTMGIRGVTGKGTILCVSIPLSRAGGSAA